MKKLKLLFIRKQSDKGQSFVEMTLLLIILLILVLGMIEGGNLLNQYINLVDGAREGARFGSNSDPFSCDDAAHHQIYDYSQCSGIFFHNVDLIVDGYSTYDKAGAIAPIILDPDNDEVMIYFLSIQNGKFFTVNNNQGIPGIWCKFNCVSHARTESLLNNGTFILDSLQDAAPNTGVLVVEIFYAYHQILNSPIFTFWVPNPIQVHTYAIMPLSAGEPTPTPCVGQSCIIIPTPTP